LKKSFGLRAAQIRQLGVAESMTYLRDMPSIRLLELTNPVALSPSKHFFTRLLAPTGQQKQEVRDADEPVKVATTRRSSCPRRKRTR